MQTYKGNGHTANAQAFGIETKSSTLIKVKGIYRNIKTCRKLTLLQNKMLLFYLPLNQ